ncbi:MAG: hypothetical protein FD126_1027 [Elusimicrobia bacterium]|nr:MAG: hypothetical protein FD126_1027 [Elusimicrobiota bacterium]
MAKSSVMDPETVVDQAQKGMEICLEAQVKAEETYEAALADLFDAAQSTLRQARTTANSMQIGMPWAAAMKPMTDQLVDLQEKALENARTASKTAFENYRRNVAEPMRKLSRESSAKLKGR